jgi:hypothetical protein
MKENKSVSVLVSNLIGYQAAEPLIDEMLSRGALVWLYAPRPCHAIIVNRRPLLSSRLLAYEELESSQLWIKWLHRLLVLALTPEGYSQNYQHRFLMPIKNHRLMAVRLMARALLLLPKSIPEMVNKRIRRVVGPFVRKTFRTHKILAVTRLTIPYLLCQRGLEITTLVESWDHPHKAPAGYTSRRVFVWNKALANDWRNFQGDQVVHVGYPLKLAYAFQNGSPLIIAPRWRYRRILYPATYTSYSDSRYFNDELRMLNFLCLAAAKAGFRIYIKPKPNGPLGDFEHLKVKFENIEVGNDGGASGPGEYFLDEKYNNKRMEIMGICDSVVNLGTTFGLDAAAYGLPVFQLYVHDPVAFPGLTTNFQYDHLRHIIKYTSDIFKIDAENPPSAVFATLFNDQAGAKAMRFSQNLRSWLCPLEVSCKSAVSQMVDSIIEM